jgi:anti-sigma factor RsiW
LDLEALASGEEPLLAPDAHSHTEACPDCAWRLDAFRALSGWLAEPSEPPVPEALVARIERLRAFSTREKRSWRLWRAPALLFAALAAGSSALLAIPAFDSSEQMSLLAAIPSAFGLEWRSLALWPFSLGRALPVAVSALSDLLLRDRSFAAISILLMLPAGLAVSRLSARHFMRK